MSSSSQLRIRRSKSLAFVDNPTHILLSWPVSPVTRGDALYGNPHTPSAIVTRGSCSMWRYLMVIHTFHQLEASEPVDTKRPMWSSAPFPKMSASSGRDYLISPFVIQRSKSLVACRAPYGYPHLIIWRPQVRLTKGVEDDISLCMLSCVDSYR